MIRELFKRFHFWFFSEYLKNGVIHVKQGESLDEAWTRVRKGGYIIVGQPSFEATHAHKQCGRLLKDHRMRRCSSDGSIYAVRDERRERYPHCEWEHPIYCEITKEDVTHRSQFSLTNDI